MDGWKTSFLLGWHPVRCCVSFRECRSCCGFSLRLDSDWIITMWFFCGVFCGMSHGEKRLAELFLEEISWSKNDHWQLGPVKYFFEIWSIQNPLVSCFISIQKGSNISKSWVVTFLHGIGHLLELESSLVNLFSLGKIARDSCENW